MSEQIIRDITKDLNGILNIADDLLVYGSTIEEHDNNLKALLDRCRDVNLTLNPKKLRFKSDNVPFFGNIVTSKGIKPDPKKVEAIKSWPTPTNVKELQSFLGAINYLSNSYHTYLPSDPLFKAWSRKIQTTYEPLLMIGHSKTSKMPYAMKPYLHTLTNQSLYS